MNSSVLALTLATLALIGSTAGSLQWLKGRVKMGNPGVRVGPVPVVSDAGRLAATHSVLLPSDISGFQSSDLWTLEESPFRYSTSDGLYREGSISRYSS